ncbi:MAG: hypothetical protein P1V35_03600, partial [Planctomycetota bacterium]|nr:hypothetical protein [Planctomycetota bacterium]
RYASMVARMTFEQAVDAHRVWLCAKGCDLDPEQEILKFLDWPEPDEEQFGQDVRIVLVSGDFSKEVTTSVLWLNERDLDIRCVRMKPYENGGRVLVDVQQVIPLPEAGDYLVQVKEKERKERQARESSKDLSRYEVSVDGLIHSRMPKRRAMHLVVGALLDKSVSPEEIAEVLSWKGNRLWRSAAGELTAEEFSLRMSEDADSGGPVWDDQRWFCDSEGLLFHQGQTWALSNQWGGTTWKALQDLLERWPFHGISVGVTPA